MIGVSNSNVVKGSGLPVCDALSFDECVPDILEKGRGIFLFTVEQSKKNSWADST
jgi:hypothetical protein